MARKNFGNAMIALLLKSPLRGMLDGSTVLIRVSGRKTGRTISAPVNYVREGGLLWITSRRERNWWRNVRGGVEVGIYLKGKWAAGRADLIEDPQEVRAAFEHYFEISPEMAKFLGVTLSEEGTRDAQGMDAVVRERVLVKVVLKGIE